MAINLTELNEEELYTIYDETKQEISRRESKKEKPKKGSMFSDSIVEVEW